MELSVTQNELSLIKLFQFMPRPSWEVVFSTDQNGRVWPQTRWGYTPEKNRCYVQGKSSLLDAVVERYLLLRPEGGRFFIDRYGAFYKDESGYLNFPPFINFRLR